MKCQINIIICNSGNYQDDVRKDLLSEMCIANLVRAITVVESHCKALESGLMSVSDMKELQRNQDKLESVVDLMKNLGFSGKMVKKLIQLRCKEIEEVQKKAALVTTLTTVCHALDGRSIIKESRNQNYNFIVPICY